MENEQTLKKQRHGCVTALLIFMMIVNSASVIIYFFASEFISKSLAVELSNADKIILSTFQIANFISCILLFQWKKIGYWRYIATNVATVVLSIYQGKGISQLWSALFGIALLFGVMQITTKNRKTTWNELS
jgi:ABC-type multidrug transport system fused ATPase/permease subunit